MGIQKRIIVLQILMHVLFLFLAAFIIIRTFNESDILLYISLSAFVVSLGIIYLVYKKGSTKNIIVKDSVSKISRYNLYVYMFAYLAQVLINLNKESSNKTVTIIFGAILVVSALFGIIMHALILIKDKRK